MILSIIGLLISFSGSYLVSSGPIIQYIDKRASWGNPLAEHEKRKFRQFFIMGNWLLVLGTAFQIIGTLKKMILHRETLKAFGYYPKQAKYNDLIIYKCKKCSDANHIKVIEKSAYDALEADRDRWYKKFTELETDRASCCVANEEENVELKAKLDEANAEASRLKDTPGGKRIYSALNEIDRLNQKLNATNERIVSLTHQCANFDADRSDLEAKLHDLEQFDPYYKNWEVERGLWDQENKAIQSRLDQAKLEIKQLRFELEAQEVLNAHADTFEALARSEDREKYEAELDEQVRANKQLLAELEQTKAELAQLKHDWSGFDNEQDYRMKIEELKLLSESYGAILVKFVEREHAHGQLGYKDACGDLIEEARKVLDGKE